MSEQLSISDLRATLGDTVRALTKRWGNPLKTPVGDVSVERGTPPFTLVRFHGCPANEDFQCVVRDAPLHDLERAEQIVLAVAQYCAAEDFTNKVNGSIRRLKAIVKAVAS